MKHTSRILRTIVAALMLLGAMAVNSIAAAQSPTDKFKNLEFREIGPAVMGGRIDDFAVVESNPNIVYVGTASGGVWKTTNNGTTLQPVFDKEGVSTIGVSPSRPPIRRSCGSEPASRTTARARRGATESTNRSTPARPGKTWAWPPRTTSAESSFIREIPIFSTSRRKVISGVPTRTAAFTKPPTAARPGSKS